MNILKVIFLILLFVSCSKSPTNLKEQLNDFTICNVLTNESSIDIYYGHFVGVLIYRDSLLFSVNVGECLLAKVPDGTVLFFSIGSNHYINIAHKGDYWNLSI